MQHPDEILANIRMKHLKTLDTYACNVHVYATSRYTFATSRQNTCNIHLEQIKHLEHTFETYVYSHYNMCNVLIYFCNNNIQHCNIPLKHLKHLKHIIATCAFSVASACCLDEWRLGDGELKATEWCRSRRCGARRRHGPQQGQGQKDGARP